MTTHLDRFGDQSFFGVGVSSSTARHAFSDGIVAEYHGATIGWCNHTEHDTIEILDAAVLDGDTDYWARFVSDLATIEVLPLRFTPRANDLKARFDRMLEGKRDPAELSRITKALDALSVDLAGFDAKLDGLAAKSGSAVPRFNRTLLRLSRLLTFITGTACGKCGQDSYGNSTLHEPVPLLAALNAYDKADPEGLDAKLLATKLMRQRHTITDAIESAAAILADLEAAT